MDYSQQASSFSLIRSLRSFTYLVSFSLFFFFKRVKTPELERRCRTGRLSTSSLFSTRTSEATRQLPVLGCITVTSMGAREPPGRAGSRSVGGAGQSAAAAGDRHSGRRAEPEWALLEGFFDSPSLNESNP